MRGRFYDLFDLEDITSRFRVSRAPSQPLPLRYNLAPTQTAPVIRFDGEERELLLMRWGLISRRAKDEKIGYRMINARAETVAEKPSFRDAYASRRLIVPVSGFYEWKREGAHRQPFAIRHPDRSPLAFAGIWETWHDLETFAIVTTEANAAMSAIHDRMPLILSPEQFQVWLDPENPDPSEVLTSEPQEELELVPVSDYVNNARHEGPQCLEEAPAS